MTFQMIHLESWERKEYFLHYTQALPCTYSMTVNLDITALLARLREKGHKLYPVMIHLLSTVVNRHEEFRTALDSHGKPGIFDVLHPDYTVFHKDSETFSSIWTPYAVDFETFHASYWEDITRYGDIKQMTPKPGTPLNTFPISCIPWTAFTGFNLNLPKSAGYLIPIFTMGRYFEQEGKTLLPLSAQVHHAVCDGFHLSRFISECQTLADNFE